MTPDEIGKVAEKALKGIDVRVYPYPVTEQMICDAIFKLEQYHKAHA